MDLDKIKNEIIEHPSNAWAKQLGYQPVYTASAESKIIIIGQAPGRKAQDSMTPWNDVSGDTLRKWLDLDKQTFYDGKQIALIPMDFYYPGKAPHGDLPPRKEFAPQWHPKLLAAMPNIKLILLVGSYSQNYYLRDTKKRNLTETVLTYQEYLPDYLPLVHPSPLNFRWRSQNPWFEERVVPHARRIVQDILSN